MKLIKVSTVILLTLSLLLIPQSIHTDKILFKPTAINLNTEYDPYSGFQWFLYESGFDKVWDYPYTTEDTITIAVIDTGVDSSHEDLQNNLLQGYNSVYETESNDYVHAHGTNVVGIIASELHNQIGISGIIGNHPIKILPINSSFDQDEGLMWDTDIIKAIQYAIKHNADVINMSFGSTEQSSGIEYWVNKALDKGIIIVAASGNSGINEYTYPASYEGVISVGSIEKSMELSYYSTWNDKVDVVAGGSLIYTTDIDNTYTYGYGTSFATPYVTGLVGIMKVVNPELSNDEIKEILYETSIDLGESGKDDKFGHGMINAKSAVDRAYEMYVDSQK